MNPKTCSSRIDEFFEDTTPNEVVKLFEKQGYEFTEKDLLKFNKLCVQFLVKDFLSKNSANTQIINLGELSIYEDLDDMKFERSWDWLMFVVEEIQHLGYRFSLTSNELESIALFTDISIPGIQLAEGVGKTPIEAVVKAVNTFLITQNVSTDSQKD